MNKLSLVLGILVIVTGCVPQRASREQSAPLIEHDFDAPAFAIPALDGSGGAIDLAAFEGQVVLLDFWATWCPPCRVELPLLKKMHEDYKGRGFVVIGMTVDEGTREQVEKAVARFSLTYPVGLAGPEAQAAYGGIRAVPTKFLLDRNGQIRQHYQGVVHESVLRGDVETLLAAPEAAESEDRG